MNLKCLSSYMNLFSGARRDGTMRVGWDAIDLTSNDRLDIEAPGYYRVGVIVLHSTVGWTRHYCIREFVECILETRKT